MTDKVERGHQAEQLLRDDGIFAKTLAAIEADYITKWRNSVTVEQREDYHRLLRVIERLKNDLRDLMTTGQIAADDQKTLRETING